MMNIQQSHERVSPRNLTAEERREKQAQRRFDADQAMKEYQAEQRAFHANHERLRAERLAREELLKSSREDSSSFLRRKKSKSSR